MKAKACSFPTSRTPGARVIGGKPYLFGGKPYLFGGNEEAVISPTTVSLRGGR